jgi:hypothetical protein
LLTKAVFLERVQQKTPGNAIVLLFVSILVKILKQEIAIKIIAIYGFKTKLLHA